MNEDFNAGNMPANPFTPAQEDFGLTVGQIQRQVDSMPDPSLGGQMRETTDPLTGAPIIVNELTYITLEKEYPEFMANRSAARLEDQDTFWSKNSMGKEDDWQAAVDGRIRSTYRFATNSWLDQYEFLSPLDKELFTGATVSDEQWEEETLSLNSESLFRFFLLGGSDQAGLAQDIPRTEVLGLNLTQGKHKTLAISASPEAIIQSYALHLGERAEGNELLARGAQGDEEAIVEMREQLQKVTLSIEERDQRVADRIGSMEDLPPDLQTYMEEIRAAMGPDLERPLDSRDRELVASFAQAAILRRFKNKVSYAAHDFLDASKTPEERLSALSLIKLGAQAYGPDYVQQAFTFVSERGFDIDAAWRNMPKQVTEMANHLGLTLEDMKERGFNPKNTITFTYQIQQEINRQIGSNERTARIMRDYETATGQMIARFGYDIYRGIADDPVAISEIAPAVVSGFGIGAGAARLGLGMVPTLLAEAGVGGVEAAAQTLATSKSAQRDQLSKGLITEVSTGQMVQDAAFVAATSSIFDFGLSSGAAAVGAAVAKRGDLVDTVAKKGVLGTERQNTAIARELAQSLSNDDIAGLRISAPNLTPEQQIRLQANETNAVDAVKVAIEAKVTDAANTDTLNDLLSPSVLDAQGISQLEAANFVQGVLRDLGPEEQMDSKTLGELWTAYTTQRKELLPTAEPKSRDARLEDELIVASREDADAVLIDERITTEPTDEVLERTSETMARVTNDESVAPKEFMEIVETAARTRDKRVQDRFRAFFNSDKVRDLIGEQRVAKINERLDKIVENSAAARAADPDLDAALRVAGFFERANNEASIRARGSVGYTKREIIQGISAYIKTAGNPTARAALEARWGKGKLQSLIRDLSTNVDDVLERTGVRTMDLNVFKKSDAYKDIRARKTARAKLAGAIRRANKLTSQTDRAAAIKKAEEKFRADMKKINEESTVKVDSDVDITIEEINAKLKSFDTMSPIERRLAMANGFSRLIDRVNPEAVSNAPVANDFKGMNRLFGGTTVGDRMGEFWSGIALWPVSQSKLFRSRTRIVRGLANFVGNRHIGTTRFGDVSGSTVEGAANAAKRQVAPIIGALRAIRSKMDRTSYGRFQSAVMRLRMTGQMAMLRKATPEEQASILATLSPDLRKAYSDRPEDLLNDLFNVDEMITNYSRQVLEEARLNGMMRLDPDGNPAQKIDPSRYVPNNLNPNLSTTQRQQLVERITDLAKKQAMEGSAALNTDVMVGLGWIRPTVESLKLDPNTGKPASTVEYEVPEDSVFFGITGKGSAADAEFVLKNAKRGREWLEEIAGNVRDRSNAEKGTPSVAHRANAGSQEKPRPTSARQTARAANEAFYVNGLDPVTADLQRKAAALRAINMTDMDPERLVQHLREYEDVLGQLAAREAELAEAYNAGDLITPNGETIRRPDVSPEDVRRLAKDDTAFAAISPGHAEQLARLDTLVKNGTITAQHKRMLMTVFAPLDLNRAVGLSMHTRSPLDLKLRQLWDYEQTVREDLEAEGIFDGRQVQAETDADIVQDVDILDEMSDDAEAFGTAITPGEGATVDFQPGLRENQNVNAATTVLHEMNHVLFFNASPEVQAAAQHMFEELRIGGVDSATGRLLQANGMTPEEIRYAMTNVHEFVAHLGEIILGNGVIKISRKGGEGFFMGLMNALRDLMERLFFRPDMDRMAGKAGFNNETWKDVKELVFSIYGDLKQQMRIADVIRTRYTDFDDNLSMRFGTNVDTPGTVHAKKSGIDENDWRAEVERAVRLMDDEFSDMPAKEQEVILKGYYSDKGLVKELFDIDPPAKEKAKLPVFEIDPSLARPDYADIEAKLEPARAKLEEMDAMRLNMLTDEDGNPRVMSDQEEAQYRQVDEAVEAMRSRIAADEFTVSTAKMSDEGYQRLLYILDHTDGQITESYIKNIIRNDGVHVPTTGGNAGQVTDSLNTIVKKAKLDFKQSNKQTAEKMGASGSGGETPTASELNLSEAVARSEAEVTDINSAEGVAELANTIGFMSRSIRDNLSDEDRAALDAGVVLLEILERAHKEGWPISSTLLDEFQYVPTVTDIGINAMKKLVKENSLHPYTWSKLDKDLQKAIKTEYKGYLKASQISSPKPTLDKMFAVLKREANTENLAAHFGESKKEIMDEGIAAAKVVDKSENKFVEAAMDTVEHERNLADAKNTDNRSAEEHMEDLQDDAVAKNPIVSNVTAANAAGEVGQAAPGYAVQAKDLVEAAREAETVQGLKDTLEIIAPGDSRNKAMATDMAILLNHARAWKGDTPVADLREPVDVKTSEKPDIEEPKPVQRTVPSEPAPVDSFYDFVDMGDGNPDVRNYEFENKAGDTMVLDMNKTVTADGEEAVGVAFHRKSDAEESTELYSKKTGSGDVRRMLTAIMNQAFEVADEMGRDNIVFTRTRGDGDRAYGMLLKRGLRDNPDWHVKTVDVGLSEVEWVVSRGPAPEGGPEIRGIKPEDAELEAQLTAALESQLESLKGNVPYIPQVVEALITDANELVERVADLDNLATTVAKLEREIRRYDYDMKAKADKEAREAAGEVDDRPVFGAEEPKAEEPKADAGDGGEEPPKDPPTAKGPDEEPEDFGKSFMEEYSDKALDEILNVGKKPGEDSVPGKLNGTGRHFGSDLVAVYDDGVNGKGTTDIDGDGIDPIAERSKQYVDTNASDTQAVRTNNAQGIDLDILVGRTSGGIDETMSRRFSDEDFESEIGQQIAEIFADNMDLASNMISYARNTGARVKIQTMLNEAFGKGVNMSKLFKEAHDSLVELIQTDAKSGTLTAAKSKAALMEAEETMKQLKQMYLHTLGYNVSQFDNKSGLGKSMNIAKNLAYSKLGGSFSQMVALVEAPFAVLRTGGMGPLQILRNMQNLLGGVFMAGAGVVGRNIPGMSKLASDYGIDRDGARFLSEDLVTFMDNFDGTSAMSRFGFTGDQGNLAAFTFKDRMLAQKERVSQAATGESRGADEGWVGATIEAGTGAVAEMTGVMSGMEQITDIARSIGINIGRSTLSKFGRKLIALADAIGEGNTVDRKTFIAKARELGIPRNVAIRANHAGLLAKRGEALRRLEEVGGVQFGSSDGKQIDLNIFNDRIQKDHERMRAEGFVDETSQNQVMADNRAVEAVQEYLLGYGRQSSPELKGSMALGKGDSVVQFLFSFLSYPMAAYQELVVNGFKANGVASTAGMLALLAAFEFNARMIRAMNDGDEEERKKALKMWQDAMTGQLSMEQYLYAFANYGTQSPVFGHFGGWAGDVLGVGLDSVLPADQAHPISDIRKQFPQSPFSSPVIGTVQGIATGMARGAKSLGQGIFGTAPEVTTPNKYRQRQQRMAKDFGTIFDTFTPFNSGAIQAFSQVATGHKLGNALGNAAFVGERMAGYNSSGATPPGFWESRYMRGYNQAIQHENPADAPDYNKHLSNAAMRQVPIPWKSDAEKKQAATPKTSTPSSSSEGLVESLPDK